MEPTINDHPMKVVVVDDTGVTINDHPLKVTPVGGGGGGGSIAVKKDGTTVDDDVSSLNFTGTNITVTDEGSGAVAISVTGGSGGDVSAANGLTVGDDGVELGGTLNKDTKVLVDTDPSNGNTSKLRIGADFDVNSGIPTEPVGVNMDLGGSSFVVTGVTGSNVDLPSGEALFTSGSSITDGGGFRAVFTNVDSQNGIGYQNSISLGETISMVAKQITLTSTGDDPTVFVGGGLSVSGNVTGASDATNAGSYVAYQNLWGGPTEGIRIANYDGVVVDPSSPYAKMVFADAAAKNRTITFYPFTPPSSSPLASVIITVKKIDSSANTVTIVDNGGGTFDGQSSIVLSNQYDYVRIASSDTAGVWYIVGKS